MLDSVSPVKATPPPAVAPCDGCSKAQRCKTEGIACEALVLYKRVSTSPARWQYAPRFPTKALFELSNEPVRFKPAAQVVQGRGRRRRVEELEESEVEACATMDAAGADLSSVLWDDAPSLGSEAM